ncbi:MAG: DUF1178 family protein [Betaproteobacteria bacterium]|nr:DUF1178 family protein [Betaproteobacteria bacterium]
MIVFELICPTHHRFEGWFASAEDFEGQKGRGLLSCPVCGNSRIRKLPTAKIGKTDARLADASQPESAATPPAHGEAPVPAAAAIDAGKLNALIDFVLMNTENVGAEFPAEARRIHHQEAPHRSIRGIATRAETEELIEEGIQVMSLPIPPRGDWH